MNRWLAAALATMLLLSPVQSRVLAEEAVSAPVEAEVLEAEATGVEGLDILGDEGEPEAFVAEVEAEQAPSEEAVPEEAASEALARYGLARAGAAVYAAPGDEAPLARLARDGAMLILGEAEGGVRVAFNTERGIVEGFMAADDVSPMDAEIQNAFLNVLIQTGECVAYQGDINQLLDNVTCEWPDAVEHEAEPVEVAEKVAANFSLSAKETVLPLEDTFTLTALDLKGKKISRSLSYVSDNPSIATVSKKGVVTACGVGRAVITVTYKDETLTCAVTVPEQPHSMAFDINEPLVLGVKETREAPVPVTFPEGTAAKLTWTSSNKAVTVNKTTGAIKAAKAGEAVITATTSDGVQAQYTVVVKKAPTKVILEQTKLDLAEGETLQLHPTVPEDCVASTFTYSTNKQTVATVSEDGVITGVAKGTAKITVKSYNNKKATVTVTVQEVPDSVNVPMTEYTLGIGQVSAVRAVATKDGKQIQTPLTFYIDEQSENPDCVALDPRTGTMTAMSVGSALIGVRAGNGIEGDALCRVDVNDAVPKSVSVESAMTVGVGEPGHVMNAVITYMSGEVLEWGSVTWTSSAPKKVAVDSQTGALTLLKAGTATITATTYNKKTASCKVTVMAAPTKITMKPASLMLSGGGMNYRLITTVTGKYPGEVSYRSDDESVATVDAGGVITTGAKGSCKIIASTYNGKTATCNLVVTGVPAKLFFERTTATVVTNDVVKPEVQVQTADGGSADAELSFSVVSGDEDCVEIDSETGAITALHPGEVVVSAQTHNGVVASNTFTVIIKSLPLMLTRLSEASVTLGEEERYQIRVKVENGSESDVTWSSSKDSVASVDQRGYVEALAAGSAVITASTPDSSVSCRVTVKKAPTKVTISPKDQSLTVGSTLEYTASVPSGCGGQYYFDSSNESVATISEDGIVTARKAGTTTITVVTYNGCKASTTLTVTDKSKVSVPKEMEKLGLASYQDKYYSGMSTEQLIEYVIYVGQKQLGMPYVYGAGYSTKNPKGFDCSGFTYWCYKHIGEKLGNSAYKQGYDSGYTKISSIKNLKRGDIVCFNTVNDNDLSDHVGIYLGDGYFIHASSAGGKVMLSTLSKDYYKRNFSWARRILD